MNSARALECLAESPPDLFVFSPLNADDMDILDASDILDVSDEELARLQAFVDEIKRDLSSNGDMGSDVEQVSEAPSAFLRSLTGYMEQIQGIRFDRFDSEWADHLERCSSRKKTRALPVSQYGSCTEVPQSVESPKEIFVDDDFTKIRKWGIESRHGLHASFRYWLDEDDVITNLVPWFTPFWKRKSPISSTQ